MMNTLIEIQASDIAGMDIHLLVAALKVLQELTQAADGDIYTDAPECQTSVNRMQDAIQAAYEALIRIRQALEAKSSPPAEFLATRILDEAEEAFAARSVAAQRARGGGWSQPTSVADFLFWIEDEAQVQDCLKNDPYTADIEQHIYAKALSGLSQELRGLGFVPSQAPWLSPAETGGGER